MAICTEVMPPEVTFADGVRVACHLYPPETAGSAAPPVPVPVAPIRDEGAA
jgi:hypothetical protein